MPELPPSETVNETPKFSMADLDLRLAETPPPPADKPDEPDRSNDPADEQAAERTPDVAEVQLSVEQDAEARLPELLKKVQEHGEAMRAKFAEQEAKIMAIQRDFPGSQWLPELMDAHNALQACGVDSQDFVDVYGEVIELLIPLEELFSTETIDQLEAIFHNTEQAMTEAINSIDKALENIAIGISKEESEQVAA